MQTRYINTASTAGGDGTTNATSGANRAYASFAEWEAARQASLTEVEEVICEGSTADSSSHTIDGWTTSAANYILIRTTQANRHNGRWDTTKYRLTSSAIEGGWVYEDYVRVEGIQFQGTASGAWNKEGLCFTGNGDCRAEACVAYACGDASYGFRVYGGTARFINCISYGNTSNGWRMQDPGSGCNVTFYNCLAAANSGNGFLFSSGTSTARNCYAGGNTSADWSAAPSTASNNASEDGTHGTTIAYSTSSGAYFTNVTGGSENFDIGSSSSFVDAGYDLSGTFTTDIVGNSRGATFDIGPFEYQSAGGDVAVALTGQSVTASAGTLGHTHAKALTGSAATVSQGTLTPLLSLALVGSSVSSAAGSLDNAASVGLTGIGLTIAQGSVGAGADVTRALTGQSVTVSAGSVGPVISKALTGISLTASAGTVSPATQVAIAGQSVTVSQGTITAQGNVTVALTGQSVTVSVGSLVPQLTKALTGGQVTSSSGSLGASISVALTGQSLSTAQGTLTAAATGNVTVALTGIEMRLYAGTIGTLGGDVAEKIGGDDVPMPSPHRGWDRRRSELKRTEEQKFLADIRRIYRDLVEEPSVADRAIEAVVQSHPEVAKQTRSANGVAEKARIAKITRRTDDLELSLRMLAQELIEFRAAAELDDERVIMRALSELL